MGQPQTQIVFSSVKLHSIKYCCQNSYCFIFKMSKSNVLVAIFLVSVAAVAAVIVQRDPFVRLIPADVLRDYRGGCFASTQCKVLSPTKPGHLILFVGLQDALLLKVTSKSGKASIK